MIQGPFNLEQVIIEIISIQTNYNMIGESCFQSEGRSFKEKLLLGSQETDKAAQSSISRQIIYTNEGHSSFEFDFSPSSQQDIEDSSNESTISIEKKLLTEHFACLQAIISKLNEKLFKLPEHSKYLETLDFNNYQNDQSLFQYLQQQKSLIFSNEVPFFMGFMKGNTSLRKVVKWIYEHVQTHLGDQLILVVHRIVLAYLPIRHLLQGLASIATLTRQCFNLLNIYCHPLLRLVGYGRLFLLIDGVMFIDRELQDFQQIFLETIILVLEQYFQNPGYQGILSQIRNKQQELREYGNVKPIQNSKIIEEQKKPR